LNDYKKGQNDLKKMNDAKSQIKAKKLNMKKVADIVIAIAIFIAVVGLIIFTAGSVASWGAFFVAFI
jgi:1,4-dihydroxy-2-naphthoate octaprenyltransferase